jgi:hypothetical protein
MSSCARIISAGYQPQVVDDLSYYNTQKESTLHLGPARRMSDNGPTLSVRA